MIKDKAQGIFNWCHEALPIEANSKDNRAAAVE
jgi:hypothetical protein